MASPFDEALSRPFIDDNDEHARPVPKKFSWTSTVATVFLIDADDDGSYQSYEAPTDVLRLAMMDDELSVERETEPLVTVDLEKAVLRERHHDIKEIAVDMKQLNEIQQDLAEVVDSQGTDIKRMSWLAIEAFDETEGGLEQLQQAGSTMELWISRQRNNRRVMVSLVGCMLLLAAYAVHKISQDPTSYNGDPQKFP